MYKLISKKDKISRIMHCSEDRIRVIVGAGSYDLHEAFGGDIYSGMHDLGFSPNRLSYGGDDYDSDMVKLFDLLASNGYTIEDPMKSSLAFASEISTSISQSSGSTFNFRYKKKINGNIIGEYTTKTHINSVPYSEVGSEALHIIPSDGFIYDFVRGVIVRSKNRENGVLVNPQPTKASKIVPKLLNVVSTIVNKETEAEYPASIQLFSGSPDELMATRNDEIIIPYTKSINRLLELIGEDLKPFEFSLKTSDNVSEIYKTATCPIGTGTLGKSCMRPESTYECNAHTGFFDLLDDVNILYVKKDGKLVARALIWMNLYHYHTDEHFALVDRIYGSEKAQSAIRQWAFDNNMLCKQSQIPGCYIIDKEGVVYSKYRSKEYTFKKSEVLRNEVPYLDTLRGFLYTKEMKSGIKGFLVSESVRGYASDAGFILGKKIIGSITTSSLSVGTLGVKCPNCGTIVRRDTAVEIYSEGRYTEACPHCSYIFGGNRHFTDGSETRLTDDFNSGVHLIPKSHASGVVRFKRGQKIHVVYPASSYSKFGQIISEGIQNKNITIL